MKDLEKILNNIDTAQTNGYFKIPEEIRDRRVIRYFLEYTQKQKEIPLVVQEEKYTKQSVMYKLRPKKCFGANKNLVSALIEYNLLRAKKDQDIHKKSAPIDNLSLAQIISFAFSISIENVFLSKSYLSSSQFKKQDTLKRIRILSNAYNGSSWFERFKRKYKRRKSKQKFVPWHNITIRELSEILCTSDYEPHNPDGNLTKLINAGLIIPKKTFKKYSPRNFVNVEALAELASIVTGINRKKILNPDLYIEFLARAYTERRLLPYLRRNRLKPEQMITLEQARFRTGIDSDNLLKRLRIKARKIKRFYSKDVKIIAVDLGIYELKNSHFQKFTGKDVSSLFGLENIDFERCGIFSNSKGNYSRHNYVFPLYETIADFSKQKLLEDAKQDSNILLNNNGDTFYLTKRSINSYKKVYNLKSFDSTCLSHLRKNLEQGYRENGKIICPEMIFKLKGREISSVAINIKNYNFQ